jgi:hypothetical protein
MHKLPHSPGASQWIDLIAFLGVLALGVVLVAFGHTTAGSLAVVCGALAGLFSVFRRSRISGSSPNAEDEPPVDAPRTRPPPSE